MQRFFDRPDTHWRGLADCLHVYAVPAADDRVRPAFTAMTDALTGVPGLGHQPVKHLHMTVQRLDAFTSELDAAAADVLADRLASAAGAVRPFDLHFEAPEVTSHAIQAIASPTSEWRVLTLAVRRAVVEAGLESTLTDPPPAPHYTLAYGTEARPDDELMPLLRRIGRPSSARVDSISLVAVNQDRHAGSFQFVVLREFPLGR